MVDSGIFYAGTAGNAAPTGLRLENWFKERQREL
jgi:hypothetical protein